MFWEAGGIGDRVLQQVGITSQQVIERLSEQGDLGSPVNPRAIPRPYVEHRYGKKVIVTPKELEVLLEKLPKLLPANVPLSWNISSGGESAWISAGEGVYLEDYIRQALAD
jgi:hypothetical protein